MLMEMGQQYRDRASASYLVGIQRMLRNGTHMPSFCLASYRRHLRCDSLFISTDSCIPNCLYPCWYVVYSCVFLVLALGLILLDLNFFFPLSFKKFLFKLHKFYVSHIYRFRNIVTLLPDPCSNASSSSLSYKKHCSSMEEARG